MSTGQPILVQDQIKVLYTQAKSRDTTNTPNYRQIKRLNKESLPMQPFQYVETRNVNVHGVYQYWDKVNDVFGIHTGPLFTLGFPGFAPVLNQSLKDAINASALNGSLIKLKGMKVNVGNTLGEGKQTVNMILGTARKIGNSLRALRRGNFRNAAIALGLAPKSRRNGQSLGKSSSKALADEWLALQFGWIPLVSDVYEGVGDLALLQNEPRRTRVTTSKTKRWSVSFKEGAWEGLPVTITDEGQYTRKYVYVFSYRRETFADLSRFGLTNPASVAWELTPWSFVVDWFIPVGKFLDALDASYGFTFEKGCRTTFQKTIRSATCNAAGMVGTAFSTMKAQTTEEVVLCQRDVLSGFPSPVIPPLRPPTLSPTRGVTISALLRQRLKL
jgi:hypothetical protein